METQTPSEGKKQTGGQAVRVFFVIGRQTIRFAIKQGLSAVPSISGNGISATYVYDGDGKRVKATVGSTNTVYPSTSLRAGIGNYYERDNGTTVRKFYYAGGVRVAMRTGGQTYYLLNDHLTSTAITTNSAGVRQTELR